MDIVRTYWRQASAALRLLLVFTVLFGVAFPLAITAVAQLPGLSSKADGSMLSSGGRVVGSSLLGQSFTDSKGRPLVQYFQSRPSAGGYDPTASGASNLGPESIVGADSLLGQVCARSAQLGRVYGVSGARPFCADGVGAVLAVFSRGPGYAGTVIRAVSVNQLCPARPFLAMYSGVRVECASAHGDYSRGRLVPIRGTAAAHPAVPSDAVTASGSGLDPDISPAFAALQVHVVAAQRHTSAANIAALVRRYTSGRGLGFLGERRVNVVKLNAALDRVYPMP